MTMIKGSDLQPGDRIRIGVGEYTVSEIRRFISLDAKKGTALGQFVEDDDEFELLDSQADLFAKPAKRKKAS